MNPYQGLIRKVYKTKMLINILIKNKQCQEFKLYGGQSLGVLRNGQGLLFDKDIDLWANETNSEFMNNVG